MENSNSLSQISHGYHKKNSYTENIEDYYRNLTRKHKFIAKPNQRNLGKEVYLITLHYQENDRPTFQILEIAYNAEDASRFKRDIENNVEVFLNLWDGWCSNYRDQHRKFPIKETVSRSSLRECLIELRDWLNCYEQPQLQRYSLRGMEDIFLEDKWAIEIDSLWMRHLELESSDSGINIARLLEQTY